eukprot:jgi/Mesen1/5125/ME000255S04100
MATVHAAAASLTWCKCTPGQASGNGLKRTSLTPAGIVRISSAGSFTGLSINEALKSRTAATTIMKRKPTGARAAVASEEAAIEAGAFIPSAPILLPEGPWTQVEGGVTAARGFRAAGMYGALRALGKKPDLALVTCDVDAQAAGAFTTNVMAAAPVVYCKQALAQSPTGDAGYADTVECAEAAAQLLGVPAAEVLIESTGVIGQRIKKDALLKALPQLVQALSPSPASAAAAAVAITTTDLVSKSAAIEVQVRIGGMAKGSGMIHPNMATMLAVVTCDAPVTADVWQPMVLTAVKRSFNQITVDGDTSTNDTVIALASGLAGGAIVADPSSAEAAQLQAAVDALCQGLAKSIAWDGEGATCLVEVQVSGAESEADAATVARSVAASSLAKAAVYGRDPNWGRIACAAGYSGVVFDVNSMQIKLGDFLLMDKGQPQPFDRSGASAYLKAQGDVHGTVIVSISIGDGQGSSKAWGCDLSYDYVKINAEYTT